VYSVIMQSASAAFKVMQSGRESAVCSLGLWEALAALHQRRYLSAGVFSFSFFSSTSKSAGGVLLFAF